MMRATIATQSGESHLKDVYLKAIYDISTVMNRRFRYKALFSMHENLVSQLDDLKEYRYSRDNPAWAEVCKGLGSIKVALKDKDQTYEEFHRESLERGKETLDMLMGSYAHKEKPDAVTSIRSIEKEVSDFIKNWEDVACIDPSEKRIDAKTYNSFMYDLLDQRSCREKDAAISYMNSYIASFLDDSREKDQAYEVLGGLKKLAKDSPGSKESFLIQAGSVGRRLKESRDTEEMRRRNSMKRYDLSQTVEEVYSNISGRSLGRFFGKKKMKKALSTIFAAGDEIEAYTRLETYLKHHGKDKVFRLQDSIRGEIAAHYR